MSEAHEHASKMPSNPIIPPSATQSHGATKPWAVICSGELHELDAMGRHSQTRLPFYFLSRVVLT